MSRGVSVNGVERLSGRLAGLLVKRPGFAVCLWGDPGIGKTHTAGRLRRETPCRHLSVHATVSPTELARALPRPARLPRWVEPTLARVQRDEAVEAASLADALGVTLGALSPFLVQLEDLHEAGAGQLEFVRSLAQVIRRLHGVGLIVTSREPPLEEFEAIQLGALSDEDTRTVLEGEVGATLPPAAHAWIQARAAGNPLFALEFLRFLARRGFLWNDGQHWRWRAPGGEVLPVTVEALVEQRLERATVNPALGGALQARAMLGREVPGALWAQVAGLGEAAWREAVGALEREGVLVGGDFAHPMYREGARRALSQERRQTLARRALDALGDDPEAAAAFVEDARLDPGAALAALERAANCARDEVGAARFLARTVALLEGETRARRALEAATGLQDTDATEAERLLGVALRERPDDPETLYRYARLMAHQKRADAVEEVFARLPEAYRESPEGLAGRSPPWSGGETVEQVLRAGPDWRAGPGHATGPASLDGRGADAGGPGDARAYPGGRDSGCAGPGPRGPGARRHAGQSPGAGRLRHVVPRPGAGGHVASPGGPGHRRRRGRSGQPHGDGRASAKDGHAQPGRAGRPPLQV